MVLGLVVVVGAGGFFYWTTTPYYAFQRAGLALVSHNLNEFEAAVDVSTLSRDAIEKALSNPIRKTQGLTRVQTEIARKLADELAVSGSRVAVANVERFVGGGGGENSRKNVEGDVVGAQDSRGKGAVHDSGGKGGAPDSGGKGGAPDSRGASNGLSISPTAGRDSLSADKPSGFNLVKRFVDKAVSKEGSLVGKLASLAHHSKTESFNKMLSDYELSPSSFKGVSFRQTDGDHCTALATFETPKLSQPLNIEIGLVKSGLSWRIERIANLDRVIATLDPDYEDTLQSATLYALEDVSILRAEQGAKKVVDKAMKSPFFHDVMKHVKVEVSSDGGELVKKYRRWQQKMDSKP